MSTALWDVSDGAHRPLDYQDLKRLSSLETQLLEYINWKSGLMVQLYSRKCISWIQWKSLEEKEEIPRSEVFLHILTRKSVSEFKKFMTCLSSTDQDHVVALLEDNAGLSTSCLRSNVLYNLIHFACCST